MHKMTMHKLIEEAVELHDRFPEMSDHDVVEAVCDIVNVPMISERDYAFETIILAYDYGQLAAYDHFSTVVGIDIRPKNIRR